MSSPQQQQSAPAVDLLSGGGTSTTNPSLNNLPQQSSSSLHNNKDVEFGTSPYVAMEVVSGGRAFENENEPENGEDDDHRTKQSEFDMSSVLTADGIHDVPGFCIVCLVILIGDMSRGAMFPSMWPLVKTLGGNEVTLGYAVAAFSFGRILVNPVFGSWSHTWGYTNTLLLSTSLLLFGEFCYSQILNVGRPEFLIVAQTLLGIGSGTLGVTRAFVADVTAKRSRTTYIALITAVQYGGFTVTPFVGALFNMTLGESEHRLGIFRLNMFTAPAYFMMVCTAFTIGMMLVFFQDRQRIATVKEQAKKKSQRRAAIEQLANETPRWFCGWTIYECVIMGCMLLNVTTKGCIASFETLGISFAESHFSLESATAGSIVATCGLIGVISLLCMGYITQHFSDVQIISGGMLVMVAGIASLSVLQEEDDDNVNPKWRYVVSIFMVYGIGYPLGHTAIIGIFSKIVGRRPQGTLQGWFASAGSLARILFPVMSGYIANYSSMSTLFILLTSILVTSTTFVLLSRRTLAVLST